MTVDRPPGFAWSDLLLRITKDPSSPGDLLALVGPNIDVPAIPFDPAPLFEKARKIQKEGGSVFPSFGTELWAALDERLRCKLGGALDKAPIESRRRLVIWADENTSSRHLPWEALKLGERAFPQATRRLAIVRCVPAQRLRQKLPVGERQRLRVLLLIGDQRQAWRVCASEADVDTAIRAIEKACAELGVLVQLDVCRPESIDALLDKLRQSYHVVHFLGHSDGTQPVDPLKPGKEQRSARGLCFDFAPGSCEPPDVLPIAGAKDGRDLVSALKYTETRLVVLGACLVQDDLARELVQVVDHVVVMQAKVIPSLAAEFCMPFYRALLVEREPASVAVAAAHEHLGQHRDHAPDFWTPAYWTNVLDDRAFLDPDEMALEKYLDDLVTDMRTLPGPFTEGLDRDDLLAKIYVEIDLNDEQPAGNQEPRGHVHDMPASRRTLDWWVRRTRTPDDPKITRRWIVLGGPSEGKTTVLRNLAYTLASERPGLIPVYRSIQELVAGGITDLCSLLNLLLGEHEKVLQTAAQRGRLVLLLDGLDEVEDRTPIRERAKELIRRLELDIGDSVLVVASRGKEHGYQRPPARVDYEYREVTLQPLLPADRDRLIENWCEALWQCREHFPGFDDCADAGAAARALRDRIVQHLALQKLAENPLCVTLLVRLHAVGESLPTHRHELLALFICYLLECRHRDKPETVLADEPRRAGLAALRQLALAMTEAGKVTLRRPRETDRARRNAEDEVAEFAAKLDAATLCGDATPWPNPLAFLEYLRHPAGLFVPKSPGAFGFTSKVFQDALTAEALVEQVYDEHGLDRLISDVKTRLKTQSLALWAEALALVTGQLRHEDRAPWLRALKDIDLGLGFRALGNAEDPDPEVVRELLQFGEDTAQRARAIGGLPAQVTDEATLLALLTQVAATTTNGDDLWHLDQTLKAHAWNTEVNRTRAGQIIDERLGRMPAPDPRLYSFSRVPTPKEHYRDRDWFWMGSPESEEGHSDDERRHQVVLTQPFWMARTSVTVAQYRQFDPAHERKTADELPATELTWHAASMFCRWLQMHRGASAEAWRASLGGEPPKGFCFQLPTEAQWEWAARGGTETRFWSGDTDADLARVGWFEDNSEKRVHPVGEKPPNPFSLHDMHGNVREWCADGYGEYAAEDRSKDPLVEVVSGAELRVLRGGSYGLEAWLCRSASRLWNEPGRSVVDGGFRVALAAPSGG